MSLGNRPVLSQVGPHRPPDHLHQDLLRVRATLLEAELAGRPADRYLAAHLAALRTGAVVLAVRARPSRRPSRPRNAWQLLAEVAPELAEWAGFFAAEEGKREVVRVGATTIVSGRQANDLLREAETFLRVVERGLARGAAAPLTAARSSG